MYDKNASGSIDVNEFQELFSAINQWKGVFQGYDKDKSGSIEQPELTQGNQYVISHLAL
jgi:Ca2+-binding EF-hand superfamily protein